MGTGQSNRLMNVMSIIVETIVSYRMLNQTNRPMEKCNSVEYCMLKNY